jgi:general secretion pathway protein E
MTQTLVQPISADIINAAREETKQRRRRLVDVLEEKLNLNPYDYVQRLGTTLHYPCVDLEVLNQLKPAFDALPYHEASHTVKRQCLAFRNEQNRLLLIISDPFNMQLKAWAEERLSEPFEWRLAHHADLAAYLTVHEATLRALDTLLDQDKDLPKTNMSIENLSLTSISADTSPVVKLVNSTIYDALKAQASDIHFEVDRTGMKVKYRIDGVLSNAAEISGSETAAQTVSRIKVMAELDIGEKRIPQDGRFKMSVQGREIDFRVSIMPSIFGEDAVLRILDKQALTDQVKGLSLDQLGFDAVSIQTLRRLASEPYGMLLVTGPTGSGKTTTLYAAISEINHGQDKIITIEDPVEYQLPGVLQIPVNEKKGLTFARGLRSILRHDPDKILVGEIRDSETAEIAVQSALTGHLVFTTVHANNVFDVIGRFVHMKVDPYSFVSSLNGILAQRLVRTVCTGCAKPYQPDGQLIKDSGIDASEIKQFNFMHGSGCAHCRNTGYKGRKAIAEILHLNDEIRELIATRAPIRQIKEAAKAGGTRYLREAALDLVRNGQTTLEEINRVTFVA